MTDGYEHSQTAWLIVMVGGNVALLLVVLRAPFWSGFVALWVCAFTALTVSVDQSLVTLRFGLPPLRGWFRKRIALDDVQECRTVRNHWVQGFGIKYIGKGWLYSVWGLDTVELCLRNGRRVRIGTDEPKTLLAAIAQHTGETNRDP